MVTSKGKSQPAEKPAETPKPSDEKPELGVSVTNDGSTPAGVTEGAGAIRNRAGGYVDYDDGRGWVLESDNGEPSDS